MRSDRRYVVDFALFATRRFDALKLFVSLRVLGEDTFAEMIDWTFALAEAAAEKISASDRFELLNPHPELNAVVFRCLASEDDAENDRLNKCIHRELFRTGQAVIAKTAAAGKTYLNTNGVWSTKMAILPMLNLYAEMSGRSVCWNCGKIE